MVMILNAFLPKFSALLVEMVQNEVGMLLGIPGQIERLGETVRDIQCILADAERKQSMGSAIERWLMQLKDVIYDADDIIDLCQIKAKEHLASSSTRALSNARGSVSFLFCCRNPFLDPFFAHEIGSKIKDINLRLEGIAKRKVELGLIESQIYYGPSDRVCRVDSIFSRKTDPSVVLDDIVGEKIEVETELVVNWLTEEEKNARNIVRVVAIVGMGGIGKTTLAKRVFSDPRIEGAFQLNIWICVSKEVKGVELLKCVIREAGGDHGDAQERSELVPLLKRLIQGKKFLLVLDDVWEESRTIWDNLLRASMSSGAYGSMLLITTRDERVAKGMRAEKSHQVEKLSDEDGWSLLIKQVFLNEKDSEIQELKGIGLQLVEKCGGLPLAIKNIGGVLNRKTIVEWETVLKSNLWSIDRPSSIQDAFHLSYEDLSSPLKQCFIFCSLFPEDFIFNRTNLIYQWLAEGFLEDNQNFWELGNEYYMELLLRNLLENTNNDYDDGSCKMHDLLWSFARQLGKDENWVSRDGEELSGSRSPLKVRRLSIEANEVHLKVNKKTNGLRTLLLLFKHKIAQDELDVMCKVFSKLRNLDLSNSNLSSIPNSLCNLVHLRYLNVRGSKISNLPNSIGKLKNLVYLNLSECKSLLDVPRSIINLQELKFFNTFNSGVRAIPAGLNRLDKLIQLFGLKPFNNSLKEFSSLDDIETLSQLISLTLCSLERVSDKNIAKRANLLNKDRLQDLKLFYSQLGWKEQLSQTNREKMRTEDALNELCPPHSLKLLRIVYYFGRCLPNWLNLEAALPNLRYLDIKYCHCFERLAPLGQLPNLDYLSIKGAYSVVSVGEEFLWGVCVLPSKDTIATSCPTKPAFPKLSTLCFELMPNWIEWQWNKGQPAMPKLKELIIQGCPQLKSLPEGLSHHATVLENLYIHGADKMITIKNLPSIKTITLAGNQNLVRICNLPSTSCFNTIACPNLKAVDLENLEVLQMLGIHDCEMETLPEYLMMAMSQRLVVYCNEELLVNIVSQGESGSEWNKFKHIPKVTIYSSDESFHATYRKTPFSFTTNICTMSVQE